MRRENIEASAGNVPQMGGKLSSDDVTDFLSRNPDFLTRPDIIEMLAAPGRWGDSGDGVLDMQQIMLNRLRGEIDNLRECAQDLIKTSRTNMSHQTRTHDASLALIAAEDFDQFIKILSDDIPAQLEVDAVAIAFEPVSPPIPLLENVYVGRAPKRTVDYFLDEGVEVTMLSEMDGGETLFGAHCGVIRSAALARIRPGIKTPPGLLAIGSRTDIFHPEQGGDLVAYFARIVERCVYRFLED